MVWTGIKGYLADRLKNIFKFNEEGALAEPAEQWFTFKVTEIKGTWI